MILRGGNSKIFSGKSLAAILSEIDNLFRNSVAISVNKESKLLYEPALPEPLPKLAIQEGKLLASNFPQKINSLSLGLILLQQKSAVLTKPTGAELLDFSDITAAITDYSKPLFLGVDFNGKAINTASSSSNVIIGLNVGYIEVLDGYTIMQVELPPKSELDINHSSLIRIRMIPKYGSLESLMIVEGYG